MDIETLLGKTLTRVENTGAEIVFHADNGITYKLYHDQSCCEDVYVEDVDGDLETLVGSPIFLAEEVSGQGLGPKSPNDESHTWTFYKLATFRGSITIRFYGTSNGYYSEGVSFGEA